MSLSMKEVHDLIKQVRSHPRVDNKPVLGINVLRAQQAQNGGYPVHMYHQTLEPVIVLTDEEREAVEHVGYTPHYVRKEYPKMLFRRNMDAKFEAAAFVEDRTVATKEKHDELLKQRTPKNASEWADAVTALPPLEDGPTEDPAVTIARMQGELSALRAQAEAEPAKKGK